MAKPGPKAASVSRLRLKSERPRSLKTSERVARELVAYIVNEGLPEGTTLPSERAMLGSLDVGRTSLREALRLLEARGVITIRSGSGGGPSVRRPRPADLSEALSLILQLEGSTFLEVTEARTQIEPVVAGLAASRIDEGGIAELKEANAEVASASENLDAFSAGNRRFHETIAENCGNVALRIFVATVAAIGDGRTVGIGYAGKHTEAIAAAHEAIIEALERRDPEASRAAMESHLKEANLYWRARYSELVLRPVRWTE
jgi:GntR family transcriptional regulator, transcriptional repressor for pyruvate dehydrogenase complex